ncbi:hypothetical protein PGUG_00347 [Meyerozyma guilliermondii ATCC 6260]|uniref:UBR-type domain-containing protein n=1 Tax=Meyerozyma guilliermondii (strain ATCC 6260 / CBS 566 / DSM 6381 / JCM 1539 / NBRC 10279 / NRRL Y-324) TaxID=294746 RepID=A5DAP2_PICGU|nr:uncharacterized protein PGUG_00347 [Meyerozyma guilliermondii ATCC 6260]EDK36249.2 hypothetical protein PGUG_00347 [Meyerozyma guilliermondii ATCC 6260]
MSDSITAVDYLESQRELEQEARTLMPFDPTECTYTMGELRQPVYACLTCSKSQNNDDFVPIGVCYSCSIQCHADHDLVELFSKRNFTCDCGTTRMSHVPRGGCTLRHHQKRSRRSSNQSSISSTPVLRAGLGSASENLRDRRNSLESSQSSPADDIPASGNLYNQNFKGLFCSCSEPYNPLDESRVMVQCHFGFVCGEDWYHEDCILGVKASPKSTFSESKNRLDDLEPPAEDAQSESSLKRESPVKQETPKPSQRSPFPNLDDFDSFICWKCVEVFPAVFEELAEHTDIVLKKLPYHQVSSIEEWNTANERQPSDEGPQKKKIKTENPSTFRYSVFLNNGFQDHMKRLRKTLEEQPEKAKFRLLDFLTNYEYLYMDDPVYEPPADEDDDGSTLLDLGAEALHSLPREQAIEGLQVYDKIRSKLRDFFKPFAEEGKVVTEDKVREFFEQMKKSDDH